MPISWRTWANFFGSARWRSIIIARSTAKGMIPEGAELAGAGDFHATF
jgi:hypothetical protein